MRSSNCAGSQFKSWLEFHEASRREMRVLAVMLEGIRFGR